MPVTRDLSNPGDSHGPSPTGTVPAGARRGSGPDTRPGPRGSDSESDSATTESVGSGASPAGTTASLAGAGPGGGDSD